MVDKSPSGNSSEGRGMHVILFFYVLNNWLYFFLTLREEEIEDASNTETDIETVQEKRLRLAKEYISKLEEDGW